MGDLNSLFGKSDNSSTDQKLETQTKAVLTLIQRQKDLESSLDLISQKTELNSNTQSESVRNFFKEIKSLKEDVFEIKSRLKKIEEFNKKVILQMKLLSTKDETKKLEKYIDLWEPLNFVTHDVLREHTKKTQEVLRNIIEEFLYVNKEEEDNKPIKEKIKNN